MGSQEFSRNADSHLTSFSATSTRPRARWRLRAGGRSRSEPSSCEAAAPFRAVLRAREEMYRGCRVAGGGDRRDRVHARGGPPRVCTNSAPAARSEGGALQVAMREGAASPRCGDPPPGVPSRQGRVRNARRSFSITSADRGLHMESGLHLRWTAGIRHRGEGAALAGPLRVRGSSVTHAGSRQNSNETIFA